MLVRIGDIGRHHGRPVDSLPGPEVSMTRLVTLLPLVALIPACVAPPPVQTPQDVSAEIRVANAAFVDAFTQVDAATVAALYTPDAELLPPGGDPVSGTDAIRAFWQGVMESGVASATLTTIEAMGVDSLAYEVGRYALASADGAPIDQGKYIVIWHRTPDGWRLYRDIWNSTPAP
jgi:uncharacterized protein (TIGR02246 family)